MRKIHWMKWEKMCLTQKKGRLGWGNNIWFVNKVVKVVGNGINMFFCWIRGWRGNLE